MVRIRNHLTDLLGAGLIVALMVTSCAGRPALPAAGSIPTQTALVPKPLTVILTYPRDGSTVEMGQSVTVLAQVVDEHGAPVGEARGRLEISDPTGKVLATLAASVGAGDVIRFPSWAIPHRTIAGPWHLRVQASTDQAQGETRSTLNIRESTSEVLLNKYGFWLDAPSLRSIVPQLYAEKGDARDGMIEWGGQRPSQHVLPANWVEIHWRTGDFNLVDPASVRRFMLTDIGDLGFTPLREIGSFESVRFKNWDAWKADCRGQTFQDQVEWLVFYAPEVGKTFAIGTTVVLPPAGIDAHAELVKSFEVVPGMNASGAAPEPLLRLLPAPQLINPELGARFSGTSQPIVLKWTSVKSLSPDEYYLVLVDYNFGESNPQVKFATRGTTLTLPTRLYSTPNCHVFNWQVTLMKKAGVTSDGQPTGQPISYNSLYWYVWWDYPEGQSPPFNAGCPNAQF